MRIVTDSAADLTPDDLSTWGMHVVPLTIQFPEGAVLSSDMTPDAFYDRLRAMAPQIPTTSQPSPASLMAVYSEQQSNGDDVLAIHVSSGLSGTVSVAQLAAREVGNVTVLDTLMLSAPQRYQVLAAAMALKKGWSAEQIAERLKQIQQASEGIYTLETLEYLIRGGRIGRVQAIAGTLLGIKPVIHVDHKDGKYSNVSKARTVGQALKNIVGYLKTKYGEQPVWVTTLHGQFAERANELQAMLNAELNVGRSDMIRISPVLGVHTGPGIVGAGVVPLDLYADLLP